MSYSYRDDEVYYSLTFSIDELRALCTKAKRDGHTHVDLEFEYTKDEIEELFAKLSDDDQVEIAANVIDNDTKWNERSELDGLIESAFDEQWDRMTPQARQDFCAEQFQDNHDIADLLKENFNPTSAYDAGQVRNLLQDAGWGRIVSNAVN